MKDQFRSKKKNIKLIVFFIIVFLLFNILYFFPKTFTTIFISGSELKNKILNSVKNKNDLISENKSLKSKIEIYENPKNLFYFYKEENKRLKKQLGYRKFSGDDREVFSIIGNKKSNLYGTFLINDSQNYIKKDDLVFYKFNLLIGKVFEKINELVKVQLFSKSGLKSNFHLSDHGKIIMEVSGVGQGNGVIKVEAPRGIEFKDTKKVFLVDKENNSYLVAELVDQNFKTQDTNKILYFKIFVNENLLSQVEIKNN